MSAWDLVEEYVDRDRDRQADPYCVRKRELRDAAGNAAREAIERLERHNAHHARVANDTPSAAWDAVERARSVEDRPEDYATDAERIAALSDAWGHAYGLTKRLEREYAALLAVYECAVAWRDAVPDEGEKPASQLCNAIDDACAVLEGQ